MTSKVMFLCKDKRKSPSIDIPVYVKDRALEEKGFPYDCRGGTIVEDLSFVDVYGRAIHCYKVKHKNGIYLWLEDDLVEIGAQVDIQVNSQIKPGSVDDH